MYLVSYQPSRALFALRKHGRGGPQPHKDGQDEKQVQYMIRFEENGVWMGLKVTIYASTVYAFVDQSHS